MTKFLCDGPNGVMMQSFGARVECGDKSNQSKTQGALFYITGCSFLLSRPNKDYRFRTFQACAVTIDDNIVITGGTMLGLGKVGI